ncbi:MAG TPA: family 1 glycosylhydrolase [Chloroflexia bacterium]|nr:family 1 glycosylhydrolase [Chloroflexia bacterium]
MPFDNFNGNGSSNHTARNEHPDKHGVTEPLFSLAPGGFAWATGIEDTFVVQTERVGERPLDEYALTHHYLYWKEDLDRAASLGVRAMRYGIPWYKVEPQPGHFEWDWLDRVLEYAASLKIEIIADLMHYGTPLWLDNGFLNHSYPERVALYAAEFARRYSQLLSHYTPLNEPLITVDFCGRRGIWPPYLRGEDGAVKILRAIARGMVLTTRAIREADSRAVIVQVDAAGEILPSSKELAEEARRWTERTFVATDLVVGKVDQNHLLYDWLLSNGLSEADLAWHAENAVELDVIGVNYYPEMSVHTLKEYRGSLTTERVWAGAAGMERAVKAFAGRYGKPVAITETSTNSTVTGRGEWLRDSLAAIPRLRREGVPLVGYTWWPLFDLVDWSYRAGARPVEDFVARMGPPLLDSRQVAGMLEAMGWNSLEQLPLEAYLAPMGLWSLKMGFDGTFSRVETPLVEQYRAAIASGLELGVSQ